MKHLKKVKNRALIYKLNKTQSLNRTEIAVLQRENNASFLPFEVQENRKGATLSFISDSVISLPEFLKMSVLSKRLFVYILNQFLRVTRAVELNRLNKNLIVYDIKYIYIEPQSWHVRFLYMPIQPIEIPGTCRSALKELIQHATFDPNETLDYVQEFIRLISNDSVFSLLELDSFAKRHDIKPQGETPRACMQCGFVLSASDDACPVCGKKCGKHASVGVENGGQVPVNGEPLSEHDDSDETRYSIGEDGNGGISFFKAANNRTIHKIVLRGKSGDIIIKKTPFRLGKQVDIVDCCIKNNAVSRRHAEIIINGTKCYIVDLNSTNGTFINGRRLPANLQAEIHSNDNLVFANEQFVVIMEG